MNVCAGILIGGQSRRMGTAKALLQVDGTTLLERTIRVAAEAGAEVVLLGGPPFDLPPAARVLPLLDDLRPGHGPIGGLETLLAARPEHVALLLACDMPRLRADLLVRLCRELGDADAVVCATSDCGAPQPHPCCASYHSRILPIVRRAIDEGHCGMMRLLSNLSARSLALSRDEALCVENWNEPGDLPNGVVPS